MKTTHRMLSALAILCLLAAPAGAGLQEKEFHPLGSVNAVAERGHLRIIGNGAGIEVHRIEPGDDSTRFLGRVVTRGPVGDIVFDPARSCVYVSNWNGSVQSIDISDPAKPMVLDTIWVDFLIQDIEVVGGWLLASAPASSEIWRIRITSPEDLREQGVVTGVSAQRIVPDAEDGFALLTESASVRRLNVDTLALGDSEVGPAPGGAHPLGDNHILTGTIVRSRATMEEVGSFEVEGGIQATHVDWPNRIAFILTNSNRMYRVAVDNPALPQVLDSIQMDVEGGAWAMLAVGGNHVTVASGGAQTVSFDDAVPRKHSYRHRSDVKALEAWQGRVFASLVTGAGVLNPRSFGPTRMVLDATFGSAVVDMVFGPQGSQPDPTGARIPGGPTSTLPRRHPVYAAAGPDGLIVFAQTLDGLEEITRMPFGEVVDVHLDGERLFVVDRYDGVHLFDLTDPWSPSEIGFFPTLAPAGCATAGNVLYVSNWSPTNLIVDISDPTSPSQIGTFTGEQLLAIEGDRLYAPQTWTFRVYDISDPVNPAEIGTNLDVLFLRGITPVPAADSPAGERHAWVARGFDGVDLYDFTDPADPRRLEHFQTRDIATDVVVDGQTIVVADGWAGISILERTTPRADGSGGDADATGLPAIDAGAGRGLQLSNAPNPVRDRTEIRFTLGAPAPVRLDLFDVAGRLVTTLLDRPMNAGRHAIDWDRRDDRGRRVAAGALFYRITTPAERGSGKMMLVQ